MPIDYLPLLATLNLACSKCKRSLIYFDGIYTHPPFGICDEDGELYIVVIENDGLIRVQPYGAE